MPINNLFSQKTNQLNIVNLFILFAFRKNYFDICSTKMNAVKLNNNWWWFNE